MEIIEQRYLFCSHGKKIAMRIGWTDGWTTKQTDQQNSHEGS